MTRTENAHNVATARGYTIASMSKSSGPFIALCNRISHLTAPDHLAFAIFRFNADGTFHSCNYFRSAEDAGLVFWKGGAA